MNAYFYDMIITKDDKAGCKTLKEYLEKELDMKDLGPLKRFLGMEVSRSKSSNFSFNKNRIEFLK